MERETSVERSAMPVTDLSIKIACAKTPTIFGYVIITCCNFDAAAAAAAALEISGSPKKCCRFEHIYGSARDLVLHKAKVFCRINVCRVQIHQG